MDEKRTYMVFIGHAWHHRGLYGRIVQMLYDAPRFYWNNLSKPDKGIYGLFIRKPLEKKIVNQIAPANIVLMSTDVYHEKPDWGLFETEEAIRQGKPIITLESRDKELEVPDILRANSNAIIPLNEFRLLEAIREHFILVI